MSSDSRPERPWSLTARLAWHFALMTSAVVLLYAAGSSYLVFDHLREGLDEYAEHELAELIAMVERSDGSVHALQEVVAGMGEIAADPPCAFRVRDASGAVVAESGRPRLLEQQPGPVKREGRSPGRTVLTGGVVTDVRRIPGRELDAEVLVDARDTRESLFGYLRSNLIVFLFSVPLAALVGWVSARRGLRALRGLVQQARQIERAGVGTRLSPEHAPEELRELALEVNAALNRISVGLATMQTFTASLAHELRSPLQNLIGETEVALLTVRERDDYIALLRSNLDDLHELSDAVDNLVAYCRSSEPQRPAEAREPFDLRTEADLRLQRERRSARRAGVELVLSGSGDTTLVGDREGVLRVLRNLVGNALVHSPAGSSVDVDIRGEDETVRLTVVDRGRGIPPEMAERIFEPFVSGRPAQGVRGGYGLGLTICRSIVREHSGRLWHEPRDGGGTRFVAEFPKVA